jgi:carbonic anhydrase/acetyltransferase-like protein (isoleucine patch superfamily)
MPLFTFEGKAPTVHPDAWIAPTATLVGDVTVEADASVWYGAVLRADFGAIVIRAGANVQDNSVIHVGDGICEVGAGATVGHLCVIHHCTIGAEALIGNGATVLDGAVVGRRAMVAAGSTVAPEAEVPPEMVAFGTPAKRLLPLAGNAKLWVEGNPGIYRELARRRRDGVTPVE